MSSTTIPASAVTTTLLGIVAGTSHDTPALQVLVRQLKAGDLTLQAFCTQLNILLGNEDGPRVLRDIATGLKQKRPTAEAPPVALPARLPLKLSFKRVNRNAKGLVAAIEEHASQNCNDQLCAK